LHAIEKLFRKREFIFFRVRKKLAADVEESKAKSYNKNRMEIEWQRVKGEKIYKTNGLKYDIKNCYVCYRHIASNKSQTTTV